MLANRSCTCIWVMVAAAMLGAVPTSAAQYGGGTGEPNDPYLIYTTQQMDMIGARSADWNKHFRLMADLDLSAYTGTRFNIIGGPAPRGSAVVHSFTGVFDGNGHTISNFTYSSKNLASVGLFGCLGNREAEVKNLRLVSPVLAVERGLYVGALVGNLSNGTIANCRVIGGSITGDKQVGGLVGGVSFDSYDVFSLIDRCAVEDCHVRANEAVGGLAGENGHAITNCYASGHVTAVLRAGGLVGHSWGAGTLNNCYSFVNTSGDTAVGGLVGYNEGEITNCYSVGPVAGNMLVGGLIGDVSGNGKFVTNSFWDKQTSGQATSAAGKGKMTAAMQAPGTFVAAGWEVAGLSSDPSAVWTMSPDAGYPLLWYQAPEAQQPPLPVFAGGAGTPASPYLIASGEQLNSISHNPRLMTAHFTLAGDIDLTGIELRGIGDEALPFAGVFDGNGKTIANLTHASERERSVGLFRSVRGDEACVLNLVLLSPRVETRTGYDAGTLVGHLCSGTVAGCHVQGGMISGGHAIGGLVGRTEFGVLESCSATASVAGDYHGTGGLACSIGGLVGYDLLGRIIDCHATGPVTGVEDVGGLVGYSTGQITDSYAEGDVTGQSETGGLVGCNYASTPGGRVRGPASGGESADGFTDWRAGVIKSCHATGTVTGTSQVGGLVGYNRYGNVSESYATGQVQGDSEVGGLVGYVDTEYIDRIGLVASCYATGAVAGDNKTGGLAGHNKGKIANCYARGAVTGKDQTGGLVGWDESGVAKCYSTGHVSGTTQTGGLIGRQTAYAMASFWDTETSGQTTSASGTGKTTAQMHEAATFIAAGWDFEAETKNGKDDIWWIDEGRDYPRLWWQRSTDQP